MKLPEMKALAIKLHLISGAEKKKELIKAIQKAEGNFDCFGTALTGECDQFNCLWRSDCLSMGKI
jgi:hypothetical protein